MSVTRNIQSACSTRTSGSSGSFDMDTKRYNHPSKIMPTGRRMIYTGINNGATTGTKDLIEHWSKIIDLRLFFPQTG